MVIVPTDAQTVRARLQRVDTWPQLFSDIRNLRVTRRGGDEWTVRIETLTFDCGAHDYHVWFQLDGTVHLQIDAHGVVGWFVSEATLRRRQESMVTRYLTDLRRGFGP